MVPFYHRATETLDYGQTSLGVRVVAYNVAKADEAVTSFSLGIGEDGLECLQVCVNVAENRETHLSHEYRSENAERLEFPNRCQLSNP
jgi:hypothetical protein